MSDPFVRRIGGILSADIAPRLRKRCVGRLRQRSMFMKSYRGIVGSKLPWAAIVAALGLAMSAPAEAAKRPWVEGAKFEFELPDLDGNLVNSADERFSGKVVLVDLWATWCSPCISEIPTLVELQRRFGDRGLIIVAIAFEAEESADLRRERLREFIGESGINYLVLDGGPPKHFESVLPAVRNVKGFPVEILVDRTGQVVSARNGYGFKKSWARKLGRSIESLLGAPPEE